MTNLKLLTKTVTVVGTKLRRKLYSYDGITWVADIDAEALRRKRAEQLHPGWLGDHLAGEAIGLPSGHLDMGKENYVINHIGGALTKEKGKNITKKREIGRHLPRVRLGVKQDVAMAMVTDYGEGRAPRIRKSSHKHRCDICTEALGREYKYDCNCATPYLKRKHEFCVKVIAKSISRRRKKTISSQAVQKMIDSINGQRIA